jgi:hypothetical protein
MPNLMDSSRRILETVRHGAHAGAGAGDSPTADSSDESQPALARFERLNERQAIGQLAKNNQLDLTAIEEFERSHADRPAVLNKLRFLRQPEPMEGYDALQPSEMSQALSGADLTTLRAVREYERKLRRRPIVLEEIEGALHATGKRRVAEPQL